jgi:hypothetical protein
MKNNSRPTKKHARLNSAGYTFVVLKQTDGLKLELNLHITMEHDTLNITPKTC